MYDVVVIGAGVVGGMIARELSAYQLDVCIVEKENDVAMGASKANSGIVHAGFDAMDGTMKARLNVRGSELMPKIAKELGVKYKKNGALVVGSGDEDRQTIEALYQRGQINGVKDLQILSKDDVHMLEKNIAEDVDVALYAPTSAIICPYELTIAAVGNAMDNGAELKLNFEVTDIKNEKGCYKICSKCEMIEARNVINVAGLFSDKIASMVSEDDIKIHAKRGEYILLDNECGDFVNYTIFQTPSKEGKGVLVTPTVDRNLLIGPTADDIESKTDVSITQEGIEKIKKTSARSVANIPFFKMITSFSGLRSVGNTGDFIINSPQKGFVNVAAIESPGLSASPAIAEYVIELLEGQGIKLIKKKNFNPYRKPQHFFREASIEEKNEIIKNEPAYGKIVCRCEGVTEGEILYAIHTNPKATDLDGVKRRTRAQMGRCQGGFCGPQIVEMLAKEMGIPFDKVTKSGGKSYINLGKTK